MSCGTNAPLYFICSRCEYPICETADVILAPVAGGTTSKAFHYDLDFLLDLDGSAPCYSGDETINTSIRVSKDILDIPMPPAARPLALRSVLESAKFSEIQEREFAEARRRSAGPTLQHSTSASNGVGGSTAASDTVDEASPVAAGGFSSRRLSGDVGNREAAVDHEHDQHLADSIPEHGTAMTTPVPDASGDNNVGSSFSIGAVVDVDDPESRTILSQVAGSGDGELLGAHDDNPSGGPVAGDEQESTLVSRLRAVFQSTPQPIRRYGAVTNARVDFVCIKDKVLQHGVSVCSEDRSAAALSPTRPPCGSATEAGPTRSPQQQTMAAEETDAEVMQRLPQSILDAVAVAPPATEWGKPGNLSVREAYVTVQRSTASAHMSWFKDYDVRHRVECPDCHLPLGFVFARSAAATEHAKKVSGEAASTTTTAAAVPETIGEAGVAEDDEALSESPFPTDDGEEEEDRRRRRVEPRSKKMKKEEGPSDSTPAGARLDGETEAVAQSAADAVPSADADNFPATFVALELKRIRQEQWCLEYFQKRYKAAQHLSDFRALFPEAEELQSLYNRLTALRTQSELYNNLLRRHKEQNDVHSALLVSQKERLGTYDEKLQTMHQIIEAQRKQLDMQGKQIRQQEDLVRSHRQHVQTQQQQIDVEQMLLTEQNKTIATQREQIRLMKAHISAKALQERLNVRRQQLQQRLQDVESNSNSNSNNNTNHSDYSGGHELDPSRSDCTEGNTASSGASTGAGGVVDHTTPLGTITALSRSSSTPDVGSEHRDYLMNDEEGLPPLHLRGIRSQESCKRPQEASNEEDPSSS